MRGARAPFVVALVLSCALHLWIIEGIAPIPERRAVRPPPPLDVTLAPIARRATPPPAPAASPSAKPTTAARRPASPPAAPPPRVVVPRIPIGGEPPTVPENVVSPAPPVDDAPPRQDPPRIAKAEAEPREAMPALQDEATPPGAAAPPSDAPAPRSVPLQDEAAPPSVAPAADAAVRTAESSAADTKRSTAAEAPPTPAPSAASTPPTPLPSAASTTATPAPSAASPPPTPAPSATSASPTQAPSAASTPPTPALSAAPPPPTPAPTASSTPPTPAPSAGSIATAPPAAVQPPTTPLPGGFPARASLDYVMRIGETGAVVGRPHIEWEFGEGRYRLQSVTKLIGVARVVPNDTWILKSEGTYSALGLRPKRFEISGRLKAGETESVDIDWERDRIAFSPGGRVLPVADGTQDLLSFMFQFALRPPEAGGAAVYVTNARKVDLYRYEWVDEETLSLPIGKFRGEHIERLHKAGEASQELWIAPERFNLPLRVRFTFRAGLTIEMQAVRLDVR